MSGEWPDGAFAARLSAAMGRRGLGLQRVVSHLAERGVACSPSTLSLWSNGRTVPQRARSLRVVTELESVLKTPDGYLLSALEAPAPPPEAWRKQLRRSEDAAVVASLFETTRGEFGLPKHNGLRVLLNHVSVMHDEFGRFTRQNSQLVLEAVRDGVERLLVSTYCDALLPDGTRSFRVIVPRAGCRLGRTRNSQESGQHVAELILDEPLNSGEVTLVEYEAVPCGGPEPTCLPTDCYELRTADACEHLIADAWFQEPAVPGAVQVRELQRVVEPEQFEQVEPQELVPVDGVVRHIVTGVDGGAVQLCWAWPQGLEASS